MRPEFTEIFEALKKIMLPYAEKLECRYDDPFNLYINTSHIMKNKQPLFFGGVQAKKNYVSYYLDSRASDSSDSRASDAPVFP